MVGTGSIATDLDHPKSFISNSIPSGVIRVALAILVIPLLAALAAMLTTHDIPGTWRQLTGLVFGVNFLRWAFIALGLALGLMVASWLLYKSLHHRGPLHSIYFTLGLTTVACVVSWWFWLPWAWGLAFGWGWLWHILADGLTEQGVPFFWPFNDDRGHTLPAWSSWSGPVILVRGGSRRHYSLNLSTGFKLIMTPISQDIETELEKAESARRAGNEGRARVCARRAAGIAARTFLTRHRVRMGDTSAYAALQALAEFPRLSPDLRLAARI